MTWMLLSLLAAGADGVSNIKPDETIVFFPTYGWLAESEKAWHLRIHAWVYEPERDSVARQAAVRVVRKALDLDKGDEASLILRERAWKFLVDNERRKTLRIRIGSATFAAGPSDASGHVEAIVRLPADEVERLLKTNSNGGETLSFVAILPEGDRRRFAGTVRLLRPEGLSIISDIDDTIKVTNVADKKELLANTFLREFEAVPGMAPAYQAWADAGASFHYVSCSPWQLYEVLAEFMRRSDLPAGTYHLKPFRIKGGASMSLTADSEQVKRAAIEPLLKACPRRRFVLVGDSGEEDPEIYGALAREHPDQIAAIFIRDVTGTSADSPRYQAAFRGVKSTRWRVFRSADELRRTLITTRAASRPAIP